MRILVVSDIHANLPALKAVLSTAGQVDGVWCLGDVVGYGPHPNQCIESLRDLAATCVLGNHERMLTGDVDAGLATSEAAVCIAWTRRQLTEPNLEFLLALPSIQVAEGITLVHGSPRDPAWEYVLNKQSARACLASVETPICLVGHTHIPCTFREEVPRPPYGVDAAPQGRARGGFGKSSFTHPLPNQTMSLGAAKWVLNPGSVGQPRDQDPSASYALLDLTARTFTFHRVSYPVKHVQEDMRRARLPAVLAERLALGA